MSLDDDDFLVKIQINISKMADFQSRKFLNQFEKWCSTHASKGCVGDVGGILASVVWVECLRGKRTSVVGVGGELVCVT